MLLVAIIIIIIITFFLLTLLLLDQIGPIDSSPQRRPEEEHETEERKSVFFLSIKTPASFPKGSQSEKGLGLQGIVIGAHVQKDGCAEPTLLVCFITGFPWPLFVPPNPPHVPLCEQLCPT